MMMPATVAEYGVAALGLVVALVVAGIVGRWITALSNRPEASFLPSSLRLPAISLITLGGLFVSSRLLREVTADWVLRLNWEYVDRGFHAAFIAGLFYAGYNVSVWAVSSAVRNRGGSVGDFALIRKLVATVILAIGTVTILSVAGVEIGPVIASMGIAGLALALALQDTLTNYFAGITLTADKPFQVGDTVEVDGSWRGIVESVGWRSTRLRQNDSTLLTFANAKLLNSVIANIDAPTERHQAIVSGKVAFEVNLEALERLLMVLTSEVAKEVGVTLSDGGVRIRYVGYAESNVEFKILADVRSADEGETLSHALFKAVHRKFFELGIPVNYPVRQVLNVPRPTGPSPDSPVPRDVI